MKKYLIACIISALVGAILAVGITDQSNRPALTAQDRRIEALPARVSNVLIDDTVATRTPPVVSRSDLTRLGTSTRLSGFSLQMSGSDSLQSSDSSRRHEAPPR